MKKHISHLLLLASFAGAWIACAQTDAGSPGQPVDNTNAAVATTPGTNAVSEATPAPATNAAPVEAVAVPPASTNEAPPAVMNPAPAAASAVATSGDANATTSASGAPTSPGQVIPLIQFSDVAITVAIEHLARQAGINYQLDPKIGYGQPDQSGQLKNEPQLSIRWENITAQNALQALLDNYSLQLVADKQTGIYRITAKDPLAPPPLITRVLQLQYASMTNMAMAVQSVLTDKRSKVLADTRTSQMLVVATDGEQTAVDTLVAELDKPTRQVLIETKLIEISSTPTAKRGVDWSSTLGAQNVTFGNGTVSGNNAISTPGATTSTTKTTPGSGHTTTITQTAQSTVAGTLDQAIGGSGWSASTAGGLIPSTAFLNADGVNATISFLNASYDAQVYSTPRVVTLDNQTAHIEVIRTYPVISLSGASANSSGSASVTYSNVGTILDVTPRISANDKIWLNVIPEVSDHFADETITVSGGSGGTSSSYAIPIFDRRKVQSQVMIPNGNTLVMGGLVQDSPNATYSKVPLLGDIPGLGWAFHSETKNMSKDNLIIFLTPTIVRDSDFQPAVTSFLQSKPKTMRSPMNPNSLLDGAEPEKNWDNPAPIPGEFSDPPKGK